MDPVQIFNAIGILNLPDWYNAGRVAQLNSFAPFSESFAPRAALCYDPPCCVHMTPLAGPTQAADHEG